MRRRRQSAADHLSPRGARTAAELSQRYPNVRVCADNQDVANRSEVVVLAVRPQDRAEALAGLRVGDDGVVISLMTGVGIGELRETLGTGAPVVRAIPLPTVRELRSVTVTCPSHPVADDGLGGALPLADESAFNVLSALTATLTTHYGYLATLTAWAARQGVPAEAADRYVRSLFQGVGRSLGDDKQSLGQLVGHHETPNGLNERIRTTWFGTANSEALTKALDALLADLAQSRAGDTGSASAWPNSPAAPRCSPPTTKWRSDCSTPSTSAAAGSPRTSRSSASTASRSRARSFRR
ncbi:pyrroline-5-carboxylate reductase [Streptomyces atratus]|uniref:Pyrroline-5-carboxylate reductase n=1 Tax=Streptomyces atratus TaxID=1893 RepID=A0A1K1XY92_STRAR|nr:pyrroline-5-carboxylate reductase [Streptomyces atratus]